MQFLTKTNQDINLHINFNNNQTEMTLNIKFLGLIIDNTLSWKDHIDYILPKLSSACYAIRVIIHITKQLENDLLFICSFYNNVRNNLLG
jgi:hypothetical protein